MSVSMSSKTSVSVNNSHNASPYSPTKSTSVTTPESDTDIKARRSRNRERAVRELLSTEKTYVHLMTKLVQHFVQKLQGNSMLSSKDYNILFPSDIIVIMGLNQTFLDDLKKVIEDSNFNNECTKIGHILQTFSPHFKMYQNYLNNYSKAATRLGQLRKKSSSSFSKYCDKQNEQKYFNNLPLESLIILPIQRIPRYKILLEEIIKNTQENHPDLDQLKQALSKISQVNDSINNRMKEFDSRIKVQHIENRFQGKITNLVTPARRYITEGQFCKIADTDDQGFLFILFSDCILYASQSGHGDKLVFGNLLPFNNQFKIQKTATNINRDRISNLFEIHSTKESFMLYAATKTQMSTFMDITQTTHAHHVALYGEKRESGGAHTLKRKKVAYAMTLLIPNDFVDKCMAMGCNTKFSLFTRRHHCLYCGCVVCHKCSINELQKRPTHTKRVILSNEMVRVCDSCYKKSVSNEALTVLENGALSLRKQLSYSKSWTPKQYQLLGIAPDDYKHSLSVGTAQLLVPIEEPEPFLQKRKSRQSIEEDLLKMYDERAKHVEQNDKKRNEDDEEDTKEDGSIEQETHVDELLDAPEMPQRRTAVLDFVKYDVEPQLMKLEQDNNELSEQVSALQCVNIELKQRISTLETQNKELRKELEQKEERIESLINEEKENEEEVEKERLNRAQSSPGLPPPVPVDAIMNPNLECEEDVEEQDINELDISELESKRVCTSCNKEIVGRALRTNGGLHHRECFVCSECGVSLAGKKYGMVFEENGTKFKVCEECTYADIVSPRSMRARESITSNPYTAVDSID